MKFLYRFLVVWGCTTLLMTLAPKTVLFAQPEEEVPREQGTPESYGWITLGIGSGQGKSYAGQRLAIQGGNGMIGIRHIASVNYPYVIPWSKSTEIETLEEVAVFLGLGAHARGGLISIDVGPGYLKWVKKDATGTVTMSSAAYGLAGGIEISCAPSPTFGVGLYGFTNVNSVKSISGMLFCVQIGGLWSSERK